LALSFAISEISLGHVGPPLIGAPKEAAYQQEQPDQAHERP
jgi:hypothetical protein